MKTQYPIYRVFKSDPSRSDKLMLVPKGTDTTTARDILAKAKSPSIMFRIDYGQVAHFVFPDIDGAIHCALS